MKVSFRAAELFGVGSLFISGQVIYAAGWGDGLPLSPWWMMVGLAVLVALALLLAWMARDGLSRETVNRFGFGVVWLILEVKLYAVVGLSHWLPHAVLTGGVVLAYWMRQCRWRPTRSGGMLHLVVLSLLVSFGTLATLADIPAGSLYLTIMRVLLLVVGLACVITFVPLLLENLLNSGAWRWVLGGGVLAAIGLAATLWVQNPYPMPWKHRGDGGPSVQHPLPEGKDSGDLPNVILISVDTLGLNHLRDHRDRAETLHNIKKLRRQSIEFDSLYSSSSQTLEAHGSLFSGLMPFQHGGVRRQTPLYEDVPLATQYLRKAGYRTAAFTDGGYVDAEFGFGRGFQRYQHQPRIYTEYLPGFVEQILWFLRFTSYRVDYSLNSRRPFVRARKPRAHYFEDTVREASRWIGDRDLNGKPFFLFLHTFQVHDYWKQYPEAMEWLRGSRPKLARSLLNPPSVPMPHRMPVSGSLRPRLMKRLSSLEDQRIREWIRGLSAPEKQFVRWKIAVASSSFWSLLRKVRFSRKQALLRLGMKYLEEWQPGNTSSIRFPAIYPWMRLLVTVDPEEHQLRDHPIRALGEISGLPNSRLQDLRRVTRQQVEAHRNLYQFGVRDMDRALGEFFGFLRERGLMEETIVVLLSDHGEGFSVDPVILDHGHRPDGVAQLDDSLTRVPLFIRLPGLEQNHSYQQPLQIGDVFPILFSHLGFRGGVLNTSLPEDFLSDIVHGQSPSGRRTVVSELRSHFFKMEPTFSIKRGRYRFERSPGEEGIFRQYPSTSFTGEGVPRGKVPPGDRGVLQTRMAELQETFGKSRNPYTRNLPLSPRVQKELRALGYMD